MKIKPWIIWSGIFMMPMFIMCMLFTSITVEYFFGVNSKGIIATFVSGGLVSNILAGLMLVNVIGVSVIMATLLEIAKKADHIDKLDEAARDLYMARRKYDAATLKLVQIQSLVEAEVLDKDRIEKAVK
jgi:hypothetical protein